MAKFPTDAPRKQALSAQRRLGFEIVREAEHISMVRENPDGTRTPLTIPNHKRIQGGTLRAVCTQCGMPRDEFLAALRG